MASDSIIASPTNSVRVIVAEASGCWARELSAVATALPSANAGPNVPKLVVMPAMTMDATAMIVMLSIVCPLAVSRGGRRLGFGLATAGAGCGSDVDRRQDGEDVGLHHAGEQTER